MTLPSPELETERAPFGACPYDALDDDALLARVLEIFDRGAVAEKLSEVSAHWSREALARHLKAPEPSPLSDAERRGLITLLPAPPHRKGRADFTFIDLFAGIGGIRQGFEAVGGECVFTSEWNRYAVRTYKANHYCDPQTHRFNEDIRDVTLSARDDVDEETAYAHIREQIPEHDVLLAFFLETPASENG